MKKDVDGSLTRAISSSNVPGLYFDEDRQQFITVVYSLLLLMLLFTVGWCVLVTLIPTLQDFINTSFAALFTAMGMVIFIGCGMSFFYTKFTSFPLNYIALVLYTLAQAYLTACLIPMFETHIVLIAATCSLIMFVWLTFYSIIFARDLTITKGSMFTFFLMVITFVIGSYFYKGNMLYILGVCMMISLMSAWIIYDTQRITGGSKQYHQLSLDDYCLGAMILYTDTILFFFYLLQLLSCKK